MKIYPHINFGGECEAAFHFYETCLGGRIGTMLTWRDSPMAKDTPAEWHSKICHASLTVGESELAGVDDPFEPYEHPKGFQIVIDVSQPDQAEGIFAALAERGSIHLPIQKTFWAARFGVLVDRFGIRWEINCGQEN